LVATAALGLRPALRHAPPRMAVPTFVTPDKVQELEEVAATDMLKAIETTALDLPPALARGPIGATFVRSSAAPTEEPPVVLLHGFDSSCLEFRRLLPELGARGVEAYALDVLGWGFGDTSAASGVGVEAKREQLYAFWKQELGGRPMTLAGVSLGAAVIIDFNAAYPEAVASAVLVDPQGFIDGAPPVPEPFARAGIRVLGSWPLRSVANQLAYYDTDTLATDEAIRIGLLHCARPGWEDDSVDWLLGGGYSVSSLVPRLESKPCLILWGRQDEILPPAEYAPKFVAAIPSAAFRWVESCGHSPHLEQPRVMAEAIVAFRTGQPVAGEPYGEGPAAEASPLERLNAFLDTPILDTNVVGGPLEPLKSFARAEPEIAQIGASVVAVSFFLFIARVLLAVASIFT